MLSNPPIQCFVETHFNFALFSSNFYLPGNSISLYSAFPLNEIHQTHAQNKANTFSAVNQFLKRSKVTSCTPKLLSTSIQKSRKAAV